MMRGFLEERKVFDLRRSASLRPRPTPGRGSRPAVRSPLHGLALAACGLAFSVAASAEEIAWRFGSVAEAMAAAKESGKPVMALFWSEKRGGCPMKEGAFRNPEVVALAGSFECAFVANEKHPDEATTYALRRFALAFVAPDGRELARLPFRDWESEGDPAAISAAMATALAEAKRPAGEIAAPSEGRERIGRPAPAWQLEGWLRGEPRELQDCAGRVLLVRFWTHTCEFCEASLPGLQELQERYGGQGLTVLGFWVPKPLGSKHTPAEVLRTLEEWGVTKLPIALDTQWQTLRDYWLEGGMRVATSASFLMDRKGVIRWLHPGPELHPEGGSGHEECARRYRDLEAAIRLLLAEKGGG